MPMMDGMQTLALIKKHSPQTRVIILSGYGSEDHVEEAKRKGSDGFINKPFGVETLIRHIKTVLSGSSRAPFMNPTSNTSASNCLLPDRGIVFHDRIRAGNNIVRVQIVKKKNTNVKPRKKEAQKKTFLVVSQTQSNNLSCHPLRGDWRRNTFIFR